MSLQKSKVKGGQTGSITWLTKEDGGEGKLAMEFAQPKATGGRGTVLYVVLICAETVWRSKFTLEPIYRRRSYQLCVAQPPDSEIVSDIHKVWRHRSPVGAFKHNPTSISSNVARGFLLKSAITARFKSIVAYSPRG
jgi:hypothetical protein